MRTKEPGLPGCAKKIKCYYRKQDFGKGPRTNFFCRKPGCPAPDFRFPFRIEFASPGGLAGPSEAACDDSWRVFVDEMAVSPHAALLDAGFDLPSGQRADFFQDIEPLPVVEIRKNVRNRRTCKWTQGRIRKPGIFENYKRIPDRRKICPPCSNFKNVLPSGSDMNSRRA